MVGFEATNAIGEELLIQHHHGIFLDMRGAPLPALQIPLSASLLSGLQALHT